MKLRHLQPPDYGIRPIVRGIVHGRTSGYTNSGCRCRECSEAMHDYHIQHTARSKIGRITQAAPLPREVIEGVERFYGEGSV